MKHGILLLAAAMLAAATGAAEAAKEGDATPCKFSCPSGYVRSHGAFVHGLLPSFDLALTCVLT